MSAGTTAAETSVLPVTYLQQEWVAAVGGDESNHNIPHAIEITGPLDLNDLSAVLTALVQRHETMRMSFTRTKGRIAQQVIAPFDPEWGFEDLSHLPRPAQRAALEQLAAERCELMIDLFTPPLWSAVVVRMAPERHVLLTIWHHAVFDGWSNAVLFRDFHQLYRARLDPGYPPPPAAKIQAGDYAAHERAIGLGKHAEFWREQFPADPPRLPAERTAQGDPLWLRAHPLPRVGADAVGPLLRLGAQHGAKPGSAIRALVLASLAPYLDDGVMIGSVTANRDAPELTHTIGLLSDHVPVRVDLRGNPSFGELAARVHEATRQAHMHRVPVGVLRQELPVALPGDRSLFDLSINYMPHAPARAATITAEDGGHIGMRLQTLPTNMLRPRMRSAFSGAVSLGFQIRHSHDGHVSGDLWAHSPAFTTSTVDRLCRDLGRTAREVLSFPQRRIRDLGVHGRAED
ncbi:condensation domain-containing protein [Promicromonospora sp. AC04]|uniref:condensation domain-containing protein n=1 Tax=Promicromonospora sp. AC04 TaxID=2135723 RepID=UPI000D3C67B8|nr:condensation domain-containing protein [Promicromonospora sp. AC04]PUB23465.1 condensation domain-containing protein [Promicromonospora sp. AC04]